MRLEVHVLSLARKLLLLGGLAALPLVTAACGGGDDAAGEAGGVAPTAATVTVLLEDGADWRISYQGGGGEQPQVSAGAIRFDATTRGVLQHEFVVYRTDLDAADLPEAEGLVDESSAALSLVLRIETFEGSGTRTATLEAGHYVLVCNLPGHYQLGMRTNFTVGP